jgi:hypothetical protein
MALRRHPVFVLAAVFASMGAQFPTTNFLVDAPTPQIAQQVGLAAEQYRKAKALEWLGREMPPWPEPCPLHVTVTMGGAGGATSFAFDNGRVLGQKMNIEGSLDRLLASVLPHEVTHTVFAHHFRTPVPRWADEGGAVLSEDDIERQRHDKLVRQILNGRREIPLRRLFALREYPNDVMCLYAEGYSVAQFLVDRSNRPTFLNFVAQGMSQGWDGAARAYYHYNSVEELEQAWLAHLRETKRPPVQLAQDRPPAPGSQGLLVRQTIPPAQPVLAAPQPIYRGQAPAPGQEGERFGYGPRSGSMSRPGYLPDYNPNDPPIPAVHIASPPHPPAGQQTWQPAGQPVQPYQPPAVRLGTPQFGAPVQEFAPPAAARPPVSPVGYPN